MSRLKLSDIFIPGAKLEVVKLKGKEVDELIKKTKAQQEAILKLKEVDWNALRNMVITI